jgi:hypothetical protein
VQTTTNPAIASAGTPPSRNFHGLPEEGGAELASPGLPATDQSRHAAWSISANASPSGLIPPSTPTFKGSTTGESHPSAVKCGEFANASDADADADDGEEVEDGDEGPGENVAEAMVRFVAKIAARVRSASGTYVLLPVRRARR